MTTHEQAELQRLVAKLTSKINSALILGDTDTARRLVRELNGLFPITSWEYTRNWNQSDCPGHVNGTLCGALQ